MSMRMSFAAAAVAIVAPLAALALPPPPPAAPGAGLLLRVADGKKTLLLAPLKGATTGTMTQGGSGTGVAYASIDLKCGDSTITLSTGNNKGSCGQTTVGGATYTRCSDGKGNFAYASCGNGCDQSGGSGSCTIKASMESGTGGTMPPKSGKALLGQFRAATGGLAVAPTPSTTTVVYATISLKCSDGVYTLTTGNSSGGCITTPGPGKSGSCQDNKGNGAMASCAKGCESSSGGGSCTFKAQ